MATALPTSRTLGAAAASPAKVAIPKEPAMTTVPALLALMASIRPPTWRTQFAHDHNTPQ
jgi:hypothetical protein